MGDRVDPGGHGGGRCPAKVYLSACDPGVGKSETVTHFARALAASSNRDVGMVISAFTIAEVSALARKLQGIRTSMCVLTSDATANALGGADANDAQILLTTQNRLGRLTEDRPFGSVTAFYYQGQPRAVRAWDKSLLPGSPVVIGADDLIGMASRLRGLSPALVKALYAFGANLLALDHGAAVDVPDFATLCSVSLSDVTDRLAANNGTVERSRDRETAQALVTITGRRVRVSRDGLSGSAMLTFREEMPADLPPMLVLDASGRVRETYALWEASRQSIVRLPSAVRDYSPLTVKVWKASGSKSGWEKHSGRLVDGIVATIMSRPEESWLVVTHRPNSAVGDTERAIRAKLPSEVRGRVAYTTWGQHCGVNDWCDRPNVILAGTLFYPNSHLTALHHLCADLPVEDGLAGPELVRQTERGEHRHLLLQAICRGRVRRSDGSRCQPMTAYVIASPRSGLAGELPTVFPGCVVEAWSPLTEEATGKVREAIRYVQDAFAAGRAEVSYTEVYAALEIHKVNFSARVTKVPAWKAAIDELGAEIVRGSRGALFVRACI